jgi:hypothetical protein
MQGVCCQCQEAHPVRSAGHDHFDPEHMDDLLFNGEGANYVMSAHEPTFGGGQCEGGGTTPQVVFSNEESKSAN